MDAMDKYPRISRSSKLDKGHSGAVDRAWRDHEEAIRDRNAHYRYAELPRQRHEIPALVD